ncbi:ATP-binding protein [Actinomadura sp. WMMB 499]|uniref:ATP-binding protein n=1 Tax=Actinomadura sp. WMMB 499 TaxID=1219491 RepID=UPI001247758D|nr:ATP-binding protein [Actinomadura sp. WMMB 499]QFG24525.1 ATP-binding protein [Actinomadura sp. WMMB 499]
MLWDGGSVERVTGRDGAGVDVREVRRRVRREVERHGAAPVDLGDVDLMVSEIATNALRYTASGHEGGGVRVAVRSVADRFRVEITDDGGAVTLPVVKAVATDEWTTSGRGLAMVAALSDCWGFDGAAGGPVTVWFEIERQKGAE